MQADDRCLDFTCYDGGGLIATRAAAPGDTLLKEPPLLTTASASTPLHCWLALDEAGRQGVLQLPCDPQLLPLQRPTVQQAIDQYPGDSIPTSPLD